MRYQDRNFFGWLPNEKREWLLLTVSSAAALLRLRRSSQGGNFPHFLPSSLPRIISPAHLFNAIWGRSVTFSILYNHSRIFHPRSHRTTSCLFNECLTINVIENVNHISGKPFCCILLSYFTTTNPRCDSIRSGNEDNYSFEGSRSRGEGIEPPL